MGRRKVTPMSRGHGKGKGKGTSSKPTVVVRKKKRPKAPETPEDLQTMAEGSFGDTPI